MKALMASAAVLFVLMNILLYAFVGWVIGSAITSSIKVVNQECDKTYKIEQVLSGDWFCPE